MKRLLVFITIFFYLTSCAGVFASMVSKNKTQETQEEIPAPLAADKILQRRQGEAHKLIMEGNKLIKRGKKKQDQSLITKGEIKKEIGEKQLRILKEEIQNRKNETSGW